MRRSLFVVATIVTAAGAGCSAAPAPETSQRPGYHGHAYILTAEEQRGDCKSIAFLQSKSVQSINGMPQQAQKQRDAPPSSMVHALHRVSGGGIPVLNDYKRERARLKALTQLSEGKQCPPVDTDGQTMAAVEKLAAFRKETRSASAFQP